MTASLVMLKTLHAKLPGNVVSDKFSYANMKIHNSQQNQLQNPYKR